MRNKETNKETEMREIRDYQITPGDYLIPDGWNIGEGVTEDDGFSDSGFPGCQARIHSIGGELAINVTVTSRDFRTHQGSYGWLRVKIEFVGDCEPSQFCGGWMKPKDWRQFEGC